MARFISNTCLTKRDLALLDDMGRDGLASLDYLKEQYWPNASVTTCRSRLSQLTQAGWVEGRHVKAGANSFKLAFFLTPKGRDLFPRLERTQFMRLRPAEYPQQLMAQRARLILKKELAQEGKGKYITGWKHEHQIRGEWAQLTAKAKFSGQAKRLPPVELPDCQATITDSTGKTSLLDIEIDGAYYGKQLATKLAGLAKSPNEVVWVTTGQRRAAHLQLLLPPQMKLLVLD